MRRIKIKRRDGVYQHYYVSERKLKKYKCVFGKYYVKVEKKRLTYFRYLYIYAGKSPRQFFDSYNVFGKSVFNGVKSKKHLEDKFFRNIGFKDFKDMQRNMLSTGYYLEIKREKYKVTEIKRYGGGRWIAKMEDTYIDDTV